MTLDPSAPRRSRRARWLAPVVLLGLGATVAACGADDTTTSSQTSTTAAGTAAPAEATAASDLAYNLVDYGFDGPSEAPAGLTRITVTNTAGQLHHLTVGRLKDGVTYAQLSTMASAGDAAGVDAALDFYGGINAISPGTSGSAVVDLDSPGDYVLVCFIPDAHDGTAHLAKGMIKPFTVTEGPSASPASVDAASPRITMRDFTYDYDAAAVAGAHEVTFDSEGTQNHEAIIIRLGEGKTKDDLLAYFAKLTTGGLSPDEQPPGVAVGGVAGLRTGAQSTVTMDLEPGHYAMFCAIPDVAKNNTPHLLEGMWTEFTVDPH